ncbi:MAG: pilus assembly protein CpaF [Myxococcota bacterium]|jgi:pilus assembly protein CpaF
MFTVTIVEKGGTERRLTFDKEAVSIGRISGNDIILPKGNISKRHARVMVRDSRFIVIDLKSTNGTYVNKERISSPRVIGADDKIYVGDFVMRLNGGVRGGDVPVVAPEPEQPQDAFFTPVAVSPGATEHVPPAAHPGAVAAAPDVVEEEIEEEATRAVAVSDVEAMLAGAAPIEFGIQGGAMDAADPEIPLVEPEPESGEVPAADSAAPWPDASSDSFSVVDGEADPAALDMLPIVEPEPEAWNAVESTDEPLIDLDLEIDYGEPEQDFAEVTGPDGAYAGADSAPMAEEPAFAAPPAESAAEPEYEPTFEELPDPEESALEPAPETAAELVEVESAPEESVGDTPIAEAPAEEFEAPSGDAPIMDTLAEQDEDEDPFDRYVTVLSILNERVAASVFADIDPDEMDLTDNQWTALESAVAEIVTSARAEGLVTEDLETSTLTQDLLYEFTGLGPVEYFLADDNVDALLITDYSQLFVSHGTSTDPFYKSFSGPAALERAVDKLSSSLGFSPNARPPIISGDLPDGTRFKIILPPLALEGPILTFRKAPVAVHTVQTFLDAGGMNDAMAEYLFDRIATRANVVVSGRRGSGRGALVNALGYFIPEAERIVVLDGGSDIMLPHGNVIRLRLPELPEERADLLALLPSLIGDRLVVSDTGGSIGVGLLELALGGAEGLLFTNVASSPIGLVERLTIQAQLAGAPRSAAETLVGRCLDIVVQMERVGDLTRIAAISEVRFTDGSVVVTDVFRFDSASEMFARVG